MMNVFCRDEIETWDLGSISPVKIMRTIRLVPLEGLKL